MTSILAAGFGFSIAFDVGVTAVWDKWNKGVSAGLLCVRDWLYDANWASYDCRSNGRTSGKDT